jgi:branched-chain amino acid transport system ATP-binding protein
VNAGAPLLATEALSLSFGALKVVDGVDFQLERGARHALIGPNGAGKTSFINLLSGALRAERGSIRIEGQEIGRLSMEQRAGRGLVRTFQISQLFRDLSVFENVSLAVMRRHGVALSMLRRCASHREVTEDAMQVIDALGLAPQAFQPVRELPYGRQRLVELAIALGLRPRILLLDEPMAGIPPGERGPVLEVVAKLDPGLAILVVDHDIEFVFRFASRITVLAGGRVLAHGAPAEISANPAVAEMYLGSGHG